MAQGVAFEPTAENRRLVRGMAAVSVPQEDIATLLEIDPKTLRRHFRAELDRGSIEATAKVAQSLFQMATQGKNVAAAIFWMKARAGWREKPVETGDNEEDGKQIVVIRRIIDPSGPGGSAVIDGEMAMDSAPPG